nr:non-ribosomal peptide synthetase [Paenibacillus xylanexedens]
MNGTSNLQKMYPLSPMQEGILFQFAMDPHSPAYYQQVILSVTGELDVTKLKKSFELLIQRHEIFRTIFVYRKVKKPMQLVLSVREVPDIPVIDLSGVSEEEEMKSLTDYKAKQAKAGFDLEKDLLLKLTVFKRGHSYKILWAYHHIIMDGWSIGLAMKEWIEIYDSLLTNSVIMLKESPSYSDFIYHLNQLEMNESEQYWKDYISGHEGAVALLGPTKDQLTGVYVHKEFSIDIDADKIKRATLIAKENEVAMTTFFEMLWGLLLYKYSDSNDIVFGAVVSGRNVEVADVESIIGLFINTIPVRVIYEEQMSIRELIQRIHISKYKSMQHANYPLYRILAASPLRQQLIQHLFIYENFPLESEGLTRGNADFNVTEVRIEEQTHYDFNLHIIPGETFSIKFSYNENVYPTETVKSISNHILNLLEQILNNPDANISDLALVSPREKESLLLLGNNLSSRPLKKEKVDRLFSLQVQDYPEKIALRHGEQSITYTKLLEQSDKWASVLISKGLGKESVVAIMMERSIDFICLLFAVMKSGGAYLPIDPEYPSERIEYMLEDSNAQILITDKKTDERFVNFTGQRMSVEEFETSVRAESKLVDDSREDDLAYILYTSGTTGKPKGVMIEHGSLSNFVHAMQEAIKFQESNCILALTTFSFDIFFVETILPLTLGMQVVLTDQHVAKDPSLLVQLIESSSVDTLQITPSRMKLLLAHKDFIRCMAQIKIVLVGGESCSKSLLRQMLVTMTSDSRIYNLYGPTETTIWSTIKEFQPDFSNVTVGRPLLNNRVVLIDGAGQLTPLGRTGELYIGGAGVARGYKNKPDMTKEKFVVLPFFPKERFYRTGDLASWTSDGELNLIGRTDHQVKLRGYRIELGEVEEALRKNPLVNDAVVLHEKTKDLLVGFYVSEQKCSEDLVKAQLQSILPAYMVPSIFVRIDQIPITFNGKVDRNLLQLINVFDNKGKGAEEAPASHIEKKLMDIWKIILGDQAIGKRDSFFEAGGTSITLIQLHALIEKQWPDRLTIAQMFASPNVAQMAQIIDQFEIQSETFTLPIDAMVPFPKDFFAEASFGGGEAITLEMNVDSIFKWGERQHIDTTDMLLTAFVYFLTLVTNNGSVSVQVLLEDGKRLMPIRMCVEDHKSFEELIQAVREQRESEKECYPINSVELHKMSDSEEAVLPLFCCTGFLPSENSQLRNFDLLTKIGFEKDVLKIMVDSPSGRLGSLMVEKLAVGYARLIERLVKTI